MVGSSVSYKNKRIVFRMLINPLGSSKSTNREPSHENRAAILLMFFHSN